MARTELERQLHRNRWAVTSRGHTWDVADVVQVLDAQACPAPADHQPAQEPTMSTPMIVLLAWAATSISFGAGWAAHAWLHDRDRPGRR